MKFIIEITDGSSEDTVVVKCASLSPDIERIRSLVADIDKKNARLPLYKENIENFVHVEDILFFETDGDGVYAHTSVEVFKSKLRLYEIEKTLPSFFVRASKSCIVNSGKISAIDKNLASASEAYFYGTKKSIFISRLYYKELRFAIEKNLKQS